MKGFALSPALKTEAKVNWPIDWAQRGLAKYRLDSQPFYAPAFLCANHGWITGLPYCFLDQSETCLQIPQASF